MSQIIFNSFPRSANVYLGHVSSKVLFIGYATVHIPEIFSIKEIYNVTVFRKPEDAISSFINKQLDVKPDMSDQDIRYSASVSSELYKKYMMYAKQNYDHIYVAEFNNIVDNTLPHFIKMSDIFNIKLNDNFEEKFNNISLTGKLWEDKYDGHYPRSKDADRIKIEKIVSELEYIQELNKEYEEFIGVHQTYRV